MRLVTARHVLNRWNGAKGCFEWVVDAMRTTFNEGEARQFVTAEACKRYRERHPQYALWELGWVHNPYQVLRVEYPRYGTYAEHKVTCCRCSNVVGEVVTYDDFAGHHKYWRPTSLYSGVDATYPECVLAMYCKECDADITYDISYEDY